MASDHIKDHINGINKCEENIPMLYNIHIDGYCL